VPEVLLLLYACGGIEIEGGGIVAGNDYIGAAVMAHVAAYTILADDEDAIGKRTCGGAEAEDFAGFVDAVLMVVKVVGEFA
jgi:hypothetical protein